MTANVQRRGLFGRRSDTAVKPRRKAPGAGAGTNSGAFKELALWDDYQTAIKQRTMFEQSNDAVKAMLERYIASNRVDASGRDLANIYATSAPIFAAIRTWMNAVTAVNFVAMRKGEPLPDDHPLQELLLDMRDVNAVTEGTLSLWGTSILVKLYNDEGYPLALRWVNPQKWNLIERAGGYTVQINDWQRPELNGTYQPRDLVYLREQDWRDDFGGVGRVEAAFTEAATQTEMAATQLAMFRNMAVPFAVVMPTADQPNAQAHEAQSFMALLRRTITGAGNFGRTVVQPRRWEWQTLQADFDKLSMEAIDKQVLQSICMAMEIPIEFLTTGQTNYAELEGKIRLWNNTKLKPRAEWYASQYTRQLAYYWGSDIEVVADMSEILREDEAAKLTLVKEKLSAGLLTLFDAQKEMGQEADDNLKGLYIVEGMPVPSERLRDYWQYKIGMAYAVPQDTALRPAGVGQLPPAPDDTPPTVDAPAELPPPDAFVPDAVFSEIKVAVRKAAKSKEFVPDALPTLTHKLIVHLKRDGHIADDAVIMAAKAHWLSVDAAKAIQATRLDFEGAFADLLADRIAGNIDGRRFNPRLLQLLIRYIPAAYRDGLEDGGVGRDAVSDDDQRQIEALLNVQRQYVTGLNAQVRDDAISEASAIHRPDMWFNKSIYPAYLAGLESAAGNALMEWVIGRTDEHCNDCRRLNGQRHRFKDWKDAGYMPRSDVLECKGFNCECTLSIVSGLPRGSF